MWKGSKLVVWYGQIRILASPCHHLCETWMPGKDLSVEMGDGVGDRCGQADENEVFSEMADWLFAAM